MIAAVVGTALTALLIAALPTAVDLSLRWEDRARQGGARHARR